MSEEKKAGKIAKTKTIRVSTMEGISREFHPGDEPSAISFYAGEFMIFNEPGKRTWLRVRDVLNIEEDV